jgi:hypothetical protein
MTQRDYVRQVLGGMGKAEGAGETSFQVMAGTTAYKLQQASNEKDMARWLPQMMASASGMKSMAGFERILASAQASAVTAGNKDQAGNNLVNLLAKLNSRDTALDFKKQGIDLSGTLAKARENGQLPLDAFVQLIDTQVVGKDKAFQALKAKAATAQGGEKTAAYDGMADILQASAVGKVVQDRQAMLALVAITPAAAVSSCQQLKPCNYPHYRHLPSAMRNICTRHTHCVVILPCCNGYCLADMA